MSLSHASGVEAAVNVFEDLRVKAQDLRRLHARWSESAEVPAGIRPAVAQAWARQQAGSRRPATDPLDDATIREHRAQAHDLGSVLPVIQGVVLDLAGQAGNELVVCDAQGVVLWMSGPAAVRRQSERLGFVEGACWTETAVGTNALGTALTDRSPIQMFGAEHSDPGHHQWVCTGAPILDPRTSRPLGAITLSGPLVSAHPFTLALVREAAARAESVLREQHQQTLRALATQPSSPGPHIRIDGDGWVAAAAGYLLPDRLRVPDRLRSGGAVDGEPVWLPTLGWFTAHRITGGHELRPRPGTVELTLDLLAGPTAVVSGPDGEQRIPLTRRQAELVKVLAAHPQGLEAQALADLVYDTPTSPVTIRAEVSRLRSRLAGMIEARPYRLVVDCNVLQPW